MTSLASVKSKAKTSYELALALADPHDKTMWIPASAVEAFEKQLRVEMAFAETMKSIPENKALVKVYKRVLGDSTFDSKETKEAKETE